MSAAPEPDPDNVVPIRPDLGGGLPWEQPARRKPVLPHWLTDPAARGHAARWARGHVAHHAAFHGVRLPAYAGRVLVCAPRGLLLAGWHGWRWLFDRHDAGTHHLLVDAAARRSHKEYATAARIRKDRVRMRGVTLVLAAVLAAIAAVAVRLAWPPGLWVLAATAVAGLAWLGRPRNRPIIGHATVAAEAGKVTPDLVVRALGSLGLASISQHLARGADIRVMVGRDGPGWHVEAELPIGTTATDVAERRERLASGLRRPLGAVWPEPAPDSHAGMLHVFVGDKAMNKARPAAWPLARTGAADVFAPLPFGTDARGRPAALPLMYSNLLTGGLPGSGKTMATRVVLLGAALDPACEIRCWELAGKGDLAALEKVAWRYGSGVDDATIGDCLVDLRDVHAELERRAKVLAGLPRDLAPENKVIRQVAVSRSLGLHPLVVAISECQELFGHPVHGKMAGDLCTSIIKRGRALAVMLVLDTQRPDVASLPTGISVNAGSRFGLRLMDHDTNDRLLGSGTYKAGIRATDFSPDDLGIGWLVGAGPLPRIIRSYYIDAPAADRIAGRALAARRDAGLIEPAERAADRDILADALTVFGPDAQLHWQTIAARLAAQLPQRWDGVTADAVSADMRAAGVAGGQVKVRGVNRQGCRRADVQAAMEAR
jgi:S-DNA-T family DNA segregation ATPase FtsK/SpoIIIE